jgi:putative flippase GtrA
MSHLPSVQPRSVGTVAKRIFADERFRFLAVGGFNTVFGYVNFVWMQALFGKNIGYMWSYLASYALGFAIAFLLHRRVVFRVRGHVLKDLARFQGVYLVPLAVNLVGLPLLASGLKMNVYLAQAIVVLFNALVSYFGHKYFSFRRPIEIT